VLPPYPRPPRSRLSSGIRTGVIAAAITAGAVVGFGLRHGTALEPFVFAGQSVLNGAAPGMAAIVGALLHLVWMMVWGVCFSVVAAPLRGIGQVIAAVVFALVVGLLTTAVLPAAAPLTGPLALSRVQIVFVDLLLAAGLVVGMRLAPVGSRIT
jgi:hypothetical protein